MKYFGIEMFDGKIYSDFPLEENEPLSAQWFFLSNDVGAIEYRIRAFTFCIDISWYGDAMNVTAAGNRFVIKIFGGRETECKPYYSESVEPDLKQLKIAMQQAVDFVQGMRKLSDEEVDALPPIEILIDIISSKYPEINITPDTVLFDDLGISRNDALEFLMWLSRSFNFSLQYFDHRMFGIVGGDDGLFRKDNNPVRNFTVKHLHKVIHRNEWFDPEK